MTGEEIIQTHLGGVFATEEMMRGSAELLRCAAWMTVWTKKKKEIYYECCGRTLLEGEENDAEEEWALEHAAHRHLGICPYCGHEVYHINRRFTSKKDYTEMYTVWYRMSQTQPDTLLVLGMWVGRLWYKARHVHPSGIRTEFQPCSLVMLPWGGKPERHICESRLCQNGVERWFWQRKENEWIRRRDVRGGDTQSLEGCRIGYRIGNSLKDTVAKSRWGKIVEWVKKTDHVPFTEDLVSQLHLFCNHPAMEYMIGNGMEGILKDCLKRNGTMQVIRWKQRKPQAMLGMDGNELARLRRMKPEETNGLGLMIWRYATEFGQKVKLEDAMTIGHKLQYRVDLSLVRKALNRYGQRWGVMKIMRYTIRSCRLSTWMDYMRELCTLGEADSVERVFPKDLHEAHARTSQRIRYKSDQETMRKVEQKATKWAGALSFEACGLKLEPFASAEEILFEGKKQLICIGSYVKTYADGNTILLKLRRLEKPEEPFHAVEFSRDGKKLIQCRGYKNYTRAEDEAQVRGFWAAWDQAHGTKTALHLVIDPGTREVQTA